MDAKKKMKIGPYINKFYIFLLSYTEKSDLIELFCFMLSYKYWLHHLIEEQL